MDTQKTTRNRRPIPEGITNDLIIAKLSEIVNTASEFISKIETGVTSHFKDKNNGLLYRRIEDVADEFDRLLESTVNRATAKAETKERASKASDPKSVARAQIIANERTIKLLSRTAELVGKQGKPVDFYTDQINELAITNQNLKQQYGITEVKGPGRPKKA